MKKLSYLLLCSALSLTACKKKYCWECTVVTTGAGTIDPRTENYCDMTESEIKGNEGTATVQVTQGGKTVTATTNTTCKKKE